MSWVEKIQNELTITTGDGKSYSPQYLNPQKSIEYNIAEFDFPGITGTLVQRKSPRGRKYPIEFYFHGEGHLDIAADFETSANDPRPWKLSHPYYGDLTVQPTSLLIDNSQLNQSKITGTLLETIDTVRPSVTKSPIDKVINDKIAVDQAIAETYAETVAPIASDVAALEETNQSLYSQASAAAGTAGAAFRDSFSKASAAISFATSKPLKAMSKIQEVISAPGRFISDVQSRNQLLIDQFNSLVSSISNLVTPNEKRQFQATSGTLVTTLAESSVTGEYQTSSQVLIVVNQLLTTYNLFVSSIDSLQSPNAAAADSYVPDADVMLLIDDLINFAVSNLFDVALNSQQERAIILEEDSNALVLTHRFYGLDSDDANLIRFIESNQLGLLDYLQIRVGTQVIYYV